MFSSRKNWVNWAWRQFSKNRKNCLAKTRDYELRLSRPSKIISNGKGRFCFGDKQYTNLSPNVTKLEIQIAQQCLLFITLHIRRSLRKNTIFVFRTERNALIKCSTWTVYTGEPFAKRLPTEIRNFLRFSGFYNSRHTHSRMLEIPIASRLR